MTLDFSIFLKTGPEFAIRDHCFTCISIYFKSLKPHKKPYHHFIVLHFHSMWLPKMYCNKAYNTSKKHWWLVSNFGFLKKKHPLFVVMQITVNTQINVLQSVNGRTQLIQLCWNPRGYFIYVAQGSHLNKHFRSQYLF